MAGSPRVLVVDDDAEMRALLLDVLGRDGYEVVEARDGAEAIVALRAAEFDVILMDATAPRTPTLSTRRNSSSWTSRCRAS